MAGWASISTREQAEAAAGRGDLEPVQLLPAELGGEARTDNIVLLPAHARSKKDTTTAELVELFRSGGAERVSVVPDYRGKSFVPAALRIVAWRDGQPPIYERRIEVW